MSLKKVFLPLYGLSILILLALIAFTYLLFQTENELEKAQITRYESYLLADELRQSSDDLTRYARSYVVTTDPVWERKYWNLLDVRNGKKPRPDGRTIALKQLMKEAGFTEKELAKLKEAEDNSNALITTQTIAMNAVKGLYDNGKGEYVIHNDPDLDMARRIMFDKKYHDDKFIIMNPVYDATYQVDERTKVHVDALTSRANLYIVAIAGIIVFLVVFMAMNIAMTRRVLKELGDEPATIRDMVFQVASGNLDIDIDIQISEEDDHSVYTALKLMVGNLNDLIQKIKMNTNATKRISEDLAISSESSAGSLEHIRVNMDQLKDKVVHLAGEIDQSSEGVDHVKDFVTHVNQQISSQSTAISESSTAIEEMSASIQSIAKISDEKLRVVNELEKTASVGESEMKDSMEIIKKVADSANIMIEMISVINGIAEQTNLLAMNAAIEAAHAGDSGKGFAVVADEIRKLAEDTSKNSKEISNSLKEVIHYIQISEESTGKTGKSFVDIVSGVKDVTQSMLEIKTAMEELALGSNEILKSLSSVVQLTEGVKNSSKEMNQSVDNIKTSMSQVTKISMETKIGMEDVAGSVNELSQGAENVSQFGAENMGRVGELEELVGQFKVRMNQTAITERMI